MVCVYSATVRSVKTMLLTIGVMMNIFADAGVAQVKDFIAEHPEALVLFYRPGCPYCQYVLPLFSAVENKTENVSFLKVDISRDSGLKQAFDFATVPTFIYFKDGVEQHRHGSENKTLKQRQIESNIQRFLLA